MNKTQSKATYTNKWLSRNRRFWHEEHYRGISVIIIDKRDAPKIVKQRVSEINISRGWSGRSATDEQTVIIRNKSCSLTNLLTINDADKELHKTAERTEELDEYDEYYEDTGR